MKSQRTSVYRQVQQAIVQGRIAPGVRVTEEGVATRTRTSRTPAREALQQLASEGFLVPRGMGKRLELVVSPLTRADVEELYLGMGALEGVASRSVGGMTTEVCEELALSLSAANETFKRVGTHTPDDFVQLFALHNSFHELLVRGCAAHRLQGLIDQLRPHVDRYEWIYAPVVGPSYDETFDEHDAICAAVATGNPDAAESAVVLNWRNGAERLTAALDRLGARGDWFSAANSA